MLRRHHLYCALIIGILTLGSLAAANPLPAPPEIMTKAEVVAGLQSEHPSKAARAAQAVAAAAHRHRDLIERILASPHERVRVVGISALESLGDRAAQARLLEIVTQDDEDFGVRVTAAEALAVLGNEDARRAIAALAGDEAVLGNEDARRAIAALAGDEDVLKKRAVTRVLSFLDDPLAYRPILRLNRHTVEFAFLLDDVRRIAVGGKRFLPAEKKSVFVPALELSPDEFGAVLDLLQLHEPARSSMIAIDTYLRIELNDDRSIDLNLDGSRVCCASPGRWWGREGFQIDAPDLVAYISERLAAEGKPAIGEMMAFVHGH